MADPNPPPAVQSIDGEERLRDFYARHGGAGLRVEREGDMARHTKGWSEVYAADGYKLRCEWRKVGERIEMSFAELPPQP